MEAEDFAYHRGVAPIMWVFFALALIELVVVHLLVALAWPWVGWPLTILSAIGAIWILLGIRSFRRLPHRIAGDELALHFGSMKSVTIGLAEIAQISGSWEAGAVQAKDALNLAGIAYPNRCLELRQPIARGKRRIFIRLDDPARFDAAMQARAVKMT